MISKIWIFLTLLLVGNDVSAKHKKSKSRQILSDSNNPRPIIGIVSETPPADIGKNYEFAESVIHSSYIHYIEMGGARIVPILINRSDEYYQHNFASINGLVFSGEDSALRSDAYVNTTTILFQLAKDANDKQDYFPVLGICAGFGSLANLLAEKDVLASCSAQDIALILKMTDDYTNSRLFKTIPDDVNTFLTTLPITYNFHNNCLTQTNVSDTKLNDLLHVLSTSKDKNNLEFVSTFEAKTYPFFGFQWSPERNPFEWTPDQPNIPHTYEAVRAVQYLANLFVQETRKNNHKFADPREEQMSLIYHYPEYYLTNSVTEIKVMHLFKKNSTT